MQESFGVHIGSARLKYFSTKTKFLDACDYNTPLLMGCSHGFLHEAAAQDVLSFFGSITLPAGAQLYHQHSSRDRIDDVYMESSGSGFFSTSAERRPCWRYMLLEPLVLPVTYRFAAALGRLFDVLPEFVAAIMPPTFVLARGHYTHMRGQTCIEGSSGARFQASAVAHSMAGSVTQANVMQIHERMKDLGFLGWAGCDMTGRHEVLLVCPLDRSICLFEGIQE